MTRVRKNAIATAAIVGVAVVGGAVGSKIVIEDDVMHPARPSAIVIEGDFLRIRVSSPDAGGSDVGASAPRIVIQDQVI